MTVNVSRPSINLREKISELDKPSGIAGEHILRSETPQEVFEYIGARNRNLIINGDMSVAQKGAGPSGSFGGSGYSEGPDRWRHSLNSCGNWQTSQSTDVPSGQGFASSLKLDCTLAAPSLAATSEFEMVQRIEGQMLQQIKKDCQHLS